MGRMKKSTRNFIRKNLKGEIERRKKAKKFQHKGSAKERAQPQQAKDVSEEVDEQVEQQAEDGAGDDDMDVDEFMNAFGESGSEDEGEDADGDGDDEKGEADVGDVGTKGTDGEKRRGHKEQIASLKQKDPEFYKFLEENDRDLLEFDESDPESGEESEDDADADEGVAEDNEAESRQARKGKAAKGPRGVSVATVETWVKAVEENKSLAAARHLVAAFKCAAHRAEGDAAGEDERYKTEGSAAFNALVVAALQKVSPLLCEQLDYKPKEGSNALPSSSKKWARLKGLAKTLVGTALHFVRQLADPSMIAFVLRAIDRLVPFFACYPKVARQLLKTLLKLWGSSEETVRVLAFLGIRRLAITLPLPFLDMCLKGLYLSFVRHAKFTTLKSLPAIAFMANCVVELYGLDLHSSYQHAFVYIRQLAIHLRNAIVLKKKEANANVYNWQFVHCLRVWAQVLSVHAATGAPSSAVMKPLVYPLVQIIIGTIRLVPTAKYFPLRFHCVKALNMLSEATGTYIPVAPLLLEVLDSAEMKRRHKQTGGKPSDFSYLLKASKTQLQSKSFQDATCESLLGLLLEHFSIHAHSIAFPELALPAVLQLRKFLKASSQPKMKKQAKIILDKLVETSKHSSSRRAHLEFSPKDSKEVAKWTAAEAARNDNPLRRYYVQWKKAEDQRRALLLEDNGPPVRNNGRGDDDSDEDFGGNGSVDGEVEMDAESDDDAAEEAAPPKKKAKQETPAAAKDAKKSAKRKATEDGERAGKRRRGKSAAANAVDIDVEDAGDVVGALVLSDDDE